MVLIVSSFISGCSFLSVIGSSSANITSVTNIGPKHGGTLKIVYDSVAPITVGYPPEITNDAAVASQLCIEGLLREDSQGNLIPWLAESYKVADNLMSVTFTLNKGVKFQDGSDFNAQVVKWNLDSQITARAQPYWASVDVLDDYTVRVNFKEWRNTILSAFGGTAGWIISKATFDRSGNLENVKQIPVGTGPFKFVSYSVDAGFKVEKNTDYWQPGKPYLDAVEVYFITDPAAQQTLVRNQGADMVFLAETGKPAAELKNLGMTIKYALLSTYCMTPDTANPTSPLAKQAVREATEYALNKEAYVQNLGYGYWEAANQIPAAGTAVFDADFTLGRQYDLSQAQKLLAEAGFSGELGVSLICDPSLLNREVAVSIQSDLQAAGITATLEYPDAPTWQTYNTQGWENAWVLQQLTGFTNYNYSLQYYLAPTSLNNKSWLRTSQWNDAYTKSVTSRSPDADLVRDATDVITQDASLIPVIDVGKGWAYQPQIMNAGLLERGTPAFWKPEQTWINR